MLLFCFATDQEVKLNLLDLWLHCKHTPQPISFSYLTYLQLHLVQQWLPVQTKFIFPRWIRSKLVKRNHTGVSALGCDVSIDGQSALTGWDQDPVAAGGEADIQAQGALSMMPDATEVQIHVIFTWTCMGQKPHINITWLDVFLSVLEEYL